MTIFFRFFFGAILGSILFSCNVYRRDILFKASKEKELEFARNALSVKTPANYLVGKNDILEFALFTNKGEAVVDPTSEFMRQVNSGASGGTVARTAAKYLIQADGCADLPILGHVKLDSLTLHQVDSLLSVKYGQFYQDVFVLSKVSNRRILIMGLGMGGSLGALGGGGAAMGGGAMGGAAGGGSRAQVFEFDRENVTLMEVLAKCGGVGRYSFANRIKVIRGNPNNPVIFTVDLTSWDSFQKANMVLQPNDIVYIEPLRRGVLEFLSDFTGVTTVASTILSIFLISRL
jgi:polysaccharide export outer membrane protein